MTNKELKLGGGIFSSSEDLLTKYYSKSPYIPVDRPMNWYQKTEFNTKSFWREERVVDESCPSINPVMKATLNSQLMGGVPPKPGTDVRRANGVWMGTKLEEFGYWDNNIIPH
jgi:hypothetical protein